MSSHGDKVYMDIADGKELSSVIKKFASQYVGDPYFLVEKQYTGEEYRLFIDRNNFFAAVHRIPANIIGDGKHTIAQLVKKENFRRMHPRNTCLCRILLDNESLKYLKKQKFSFKYVPKAREVVKLRKNSNVSTGGNCYDVTDQVHSQYIRFAKKVLKAYDAPFIGIDLMCADISKKSKDFVICELNSAPGLSLHMMPEKGKPRDVAGAITDVIFPETRK
jgi:D-alanine-D-alanine ligase-like ATP-grasp enzyme